MTHTRFSFAFAVAALVLTIIIIWRDPFYLVTFGGHGEVVWWAFWLTMITVTITHAALLTIMLVRQRTWQPVESALFDFICIDGLFWGTTAWFIRGTASERGVPLINVALAALMLIATVRFNVMAVRLYIIGTGPSPTIVDGESEDRVLYEGVERRKVWPGRRFGDTR